jgi:hypothetical protein
MARCEWSRRRPSVSRNAGSSPAPPRYVFTLGFRRRNSTTYESCRRRKEASLLAGVVGLEAGDAHRTAAVRTRGRSGRRRMACRSLDGHYRNRTHRPQTLKRQAGDPCHRHRWGFRQQRADGRQSPLATNAITGIILREQSSAFGAPDSCVLVRGLISSPCVVAASGKRFRELVLMQLLSNLITTG